MGKKVLVLVPGQNARGGVTTYYNALRKHLPESDVYYLERGARVFPYKKTLIKEVIRLGTDYLRFIKVLLSKRIDIVHTNTSFDRSGIYRDSIYIIVAKFFRKKTIIFYRGWDDSYAEELFTRDNWLRKTLLSVDTSIVLAEKFKNDLLKANYKRRIYVETTTVDMDLMDLKKTISNIKSNKTDYNILYLARLEKDKGIYIVLEAYMEVKKNHPNVRLFVGGDGQEHENIGRMIKEQSIQDVTLFGFVSGKEKARLLVSADVYIFPTNYKEGMPNSVLEAFAFGLPVITRPIAGLKDIFTNENGFLINSLNSEEYVKAIELLINNRTLSNKISAHNLRYAEDNFISPVVSKRLLSIYSHM